MLPLSVLPRFAMVAAVSLAAIPLARAAERSSALAGSRLVIDSPCARDVDVQPDASLHDQVMVAASAEHEEELDHLLLEDGKTVRLRTKPGSCWRPSPSDAWRPTLRLAVRVPEDFGVTIDESSVASYVLGAVGSLSLDLSGVGEVKAQSATDLKIDLSGTGHVSVATAHGAAKMELSGGGSITIATATLPTLTADLSGAGSIVVDAGEIGQATVESSGTGNVRIGSVVGNAHADLSGMGSVRFAQVTGQLEKEVSGLGSVTVGR